MDFGGNRAEAERWLYTANKLLSARDLHGARSFALRARESDPRFEATEHLLTVIDVLLAGANRINNQHDWYGILQIFRYTQNIEFIASQYRRLALILDPHRNRFSFAGHAFSLVHDAWSVLSNPAKKALYDNELRIATEPPPPPPDPNPIPNLFLSPSPTPIPPPTQSQNPARKTLRSTEERVIFEEERPNVNNVTEPTPQPETTRSPESSRASDNEIGNFWTACPYCFVLYEYPRIYRECTLRCPRCERAFHAAMVPSPIETGNDTYFCCWGFFPLGCSANFKGTSGSSSSSKWNPFSSMFACPLQMGANPKPKSWAYYDDEAAAAFIELSDSSDDDDVDWRNSNPRKKKRPRQSTYYVGSSTKKQSTERGQTKKGNNSGAGHNKLSNGGSVVPNAARTENSKKAVLGSSRRRGAADLGKLDLNVEFSNEVEEPNQGIREREGRACEEREGREGNGTGHEADNIEGIGFFEGLDEFLSSLPILNVVGDDKVKSH
ncbi:hypothetical protein L6164_036389 [Bauhinia variegata]|uniref:Uncharacterized protein n=1 Tax=Bauhinia variegata TaxID=167791 RepID=A0ACB9KGW6_BAUVA|nr:hypothetical protein L6164_036389 [Bauhinia variegata]